MAILSMDILFHPLYRNENGPSARELPWQVQCPLFVQQQQLRAQPYYNECVNAGTDDDEPAAPGLEEIGRDHASGGQDPKSFASAHAAAALQRSDARKESIAAWRTRVAEARGGIEYIQSLAARVSSIVAARGGLDWASLQPCDDGADEGPKSGALVPESKRGGGPGDRRPGCGAGGGRGTVVDVEGKKTGGESGDEGEREKDRRERAEGGVGAQYEVEMSRRGSRRSMSAKHMSQSMAIVAHMANHGLCRMLTGEDENDKGDGWNAVAPTYFGEVSLCYILHLPSLLCFLFRCPVLSLLFYVLYLLLCFLSLPLTSSSPPSPCFLPLSALPYLRHPPLHPHSKPNKQNPIPASTRPLILHPPSLGSQ